MDQLNYYDLENILGKCVSGEIDIHEPIEVTNKLKNQKTEMSVLRHLLLLCQSDKKSLIHILSVLRYKIKSKLLELIDSNPFIRHYIQNVIHEWSLDIAPVDLFRDGLDQCNYSEGSDLFDYGQLMLEKRNIQEGGYKLKIFEEGMKTRQEEYKPMTSDYAESIQDKVRDLHTWCYECMGRIKHQASSSMEIHNLLDPRHKDIIIDLSSKSKSSYMEYSHRIKGQDSSTFATFLNEKQDLDIPDNIHTIFLNYLITLNMIKKEMNFITHSFKGLLTDIQPKMVILTKFMDGLNELEGLIDKPDDVDDVDVDDVDEGPVQIIDSSGQIKEVGGDDGVDDDGALAFIKKGFSFF